MIVTETLIEEWAIDVIDAVLERCPAIAQNAPLNELKTIAEWEAAHVMSPHLDDEDYEDTLDQVAEIVVGVLDFRRRNS